MALTRKQTHLIKEVTEEFNIDEHGGGVSQFVCNSTQEHLRTEQVVLRSGTTTFRLHSSQTEFEDVQSLAV
jgi:hypothetical protein